MTHLIKEYPNLIQSSHKLIEQVHLKQVKGTTLPVRSKLSNDPYVRHSELKRELNALETRIESKFDEVNKRFDEINAKFVDINDKIGQMSTTLKLILDKMSISNQ